MAALAKATFIAILLAIIGTMAVRDTPEFLHICRTKDSNFEECIIESVEFLKPYLKKGVPDYNIPSVEIIHLDSVKASPMNSMQIQINNVNVTGLLNFKVTSVKMDFKTLNIHMNLNIPYFAVEGTYEVDGKIFILPIKGSGPLHGNFTNCIVRFDVASERLMEDDVERFHIKEFNVKLTLGKGYLKLDNLLGDKTLGDAINGAINSNLDLFMQNIIPSAEKELSDVFQKLLDKIIRQFPFSQLFPDL